MNWKIEMDWNNDGVYEVDEVARLKSLHIERGRESLFEDPMIGYCDLVLGNYDGRYDAWKADSPFYPHVAPGAKVKISVIIGGNTYALFTGRVMDPKSSRIKASNADPVGEFRQFVLRIHDGWQWLLDQEISVALVQNTTTQAAIQAALNASGFVQAAGLWLVGSGQLDSTTVLGGLYGENLSLGSNVGDVIPYWWVEKEPVSQNILDLVRSNFGRVQINGDGQFVFSSRTNDNGSASSFTLTDSMLQEMQVSYPWQEVKNQVRIRVTPRALAALGTVWQNAETIYLGSGESQTIQAEYRDPTTGEFSPAINLVSPVATTDYTANDNSDGSGVNRTANLGVTMTAYSSYANIVIVNNASVPIYVTLLKVRGQLVTGLKEQSVYSEDAYSKERYGRKLYETDLRWQQKTLVAQDLADWIVSFQKEPKDVLEIQWESAENAVKYELGTKITDGTTKGAGGTYRISKITHDLVDDQGAQKLITRWKCLRHPTDTYWQLDSETVSQLGVSAVLGI